MNRRFRRLKRGAALATTVAIGLTPALVAAPAAHAAAPVPVTRIAGANRFGTAAAVAEKAFPSGASTVIVATGFNFPDALAGNYLAGVDKAPILLVNVDNVPSETSAALTTLKAKNVIILGQTDAVDSNTENQLKSAGYTTSRIGGATRYDTMQMIDEAPNATTIGTINGKKTALLARGDNFPDALGGGPVAYAKNFPVILTPTTGLAPQAQDVIQKDGIQQVIILGGTIAVPTAVEQQANAAGAATLFRADGVDRSDTSRKLAEYELSTLGFVNTSYAIASGDQYFTGADALASGPFSGSFPQPTLITNSVNDPGTLVQFGQAHNATETNCYAIGGPIPLPDSTVNAVCNATPGSNAAYAVSPSTSTSANTSGGTTQNVTYTVSGLTNGVPVDIQLFNCANVSTTNGATTFNNSSNPGGSGNVAQPGTVAPATITQVNGAGVGAAAQQNNITPTNGTVSFVVSSNAPGCVVPVVYSNADADNLLNLGTNNQPTEPFGVGGSASFFNAAPAGTFTAASACAPAVASNVTSSSSSSFTQGGCTYTYGASDVYQLVVGGACTASSYAAFQSRLTTGDNVSGFYNAPNQSTFCLNDIAPAPPAGVATGAGTGPNAGQAGIQVTFTDSTTPSVASYNVYRATATQPTVTGGSVTCPTLTSPGSGVSPQTPPSASSGYSKIGSMTDATPTTSGGETYVFFDSTATVPPTATPTNPQYCYAVTSVDAAGQEGSPSAVAGPATASASSTAPKFASAAASAGAHTVTVTYNEALTCSSVDTNASDYSVVYTSGSVSTAVTPTAASCANTGAGGVGVVTITAPAGSFGAGANAGTVTVTAKNGTDGNTVSNTLSTPQFQPVGDAVTTGAGGVGA